MGGSTNDNCSIYIYTSIASTDNTCSIPCKVEFLRGRGRERTASGRGDGGDDGGVRHRRHPARERKKYEMTFIKRLGHIQSGYKRVRRAVGEAAGQTVESDCRVV